jgi:hypothetical protein
MMRDCDGSETGVTSVKSLVIGLLSRVSEGPQPVRGGGLHLPDRYTAERQEGIVARLPVA